MNVPTYSRFIVSSEPTNAMGHTALSVPTCRKEREIVDLASVHTSELKLPLRPPSSLRVAKTGPWLVDRRRHWHPEANGARLGAWAMARGFAWKGG